MKLSDIMGEAGFVTWAEAGLIVSLVTFTAILIYVFVIRSRASFEKARLLPLSEDEGGCQVRSSAVARNHGTAEPPVTSSGNGGTADLAPREVSS
jgi:hypothetical protein